VESLALIASLVFLAVVSLGPVAVLFSVYGYVYIGGTVGIIAFSAGVWWAFVMTGPVAIFGVISAGFGLFAALQACRSDPR